MTQPLTLGAPPQSGWEPPPHPIAILPGQFRPQGFEDLPALARYIHRERRGRGLRLSESVGSYAGSATFPAVIVRFRLDDDEQYAFTVALAGRSRAALEAAIAAANPIAT